MSASSSIIPPHSALRFRDFRLFMAARYFWMAAAQMQSVAIGWHVYDITRDPLALGYVGLAIFLPSIGFALLTGHAADRFDRRHILLITALGQALCSVLLFFLVKQKETSVYGIYAILVLAGTARAFAGPAGQALVPSLVPTEVFSNAIAWGSSAWQLAMITGPALGGLVYGWSKGSNMIYAACVVTFLTSWTLLFLMHIRTGRLEHRAATLETLFAGVRYVWQRKVIFGAISLDLFAVLLGGSVALLPVFARDILKVGPEGLGILRAGPAMGAAMMALFFAHFPLRRKAGRFMLSAVGLFGLATIAFGLSRSFVLSLLCLVVLGASDMVSVIVRQTVVQLATPSEMRGRVSAVSQIFIGASNELGEFESGLTAAWWGAVRAVMVGGVGTCIVVGSWAWLFPELRKVDRLDKALDK